MIYYTRRQALVFHSIPIIVFVLVPFFLRLSHLGFWCSIATFGDFLIGLLFHVTGILLAILVPIIFSIVRLLFSSHSMNWFGNPYLAYMMFVPPLSCWSTNTKIGLEILSTLSESKSSIVVTRGDRFEKS